MKSPGSTKPARAFTVFELLLVVFTLLLLLVLFGPGMFQRTQGTNCRVQCVNNLKQVGLCFRTFAIDNQDKFPMQVSVTNGGTMELIASGWVYPHFQILSNELSTPVILLCPDDSSRTRASSFSRNFDNRNISYFIGIDAANSSPQTILAGDDNLIVGGKYRKRGLMELGTNGPTVTWAPDRHESHGNLLMSDGSVQQVSDLRLSGFLRNSASTPNRLLMP